MSNALPRTVADPVRGDFFENMIMETHCPEESLMPFWFWNGEVTETELIRQLELAAASGVDGLVIHARRGNRIAYLSERWFALWRCACLAARRLGLTLWIYDEEGFPSGTVSGRLPKLGEAFQQKFLSFLEMTAGEALAAGNVVRFFDRARPDRPLSRAEIRPDMTLLVFQRGLNPASVDFFQPSLTEKFLELTHEQYRRHLGEFFGTTITGVFTDDSHLLEPGGPRLAYSDDFEADFAARHGYSLLDSLGRLVDNLPDSGRVRRDYYHYCAERFAAAFLRPVRRWCEANSLAFYGHLCGDEGPFHVILRKSADPSLYYREFAAPGVDDYLSFHFEGRYLRDPVNSLQGGGWFCRTPGFSAANLIRAAVSVSAQTGNGNCMAEVLASLGWGVPPELLRAHLNFFLLHGANQLVPHYFGYSTSGDTKRDHPASYFFQEPYFAVSNDLFRDVRRSRRLLGYGRPAAGVLVWHPIDSVQTATDGGVIEEPGAFQSVRPGCRRDCAFYSGMLAELDLALSQRQVPFHFGFESIVAECGSVCGDLLQIGSAAYRTVILPWLEALRPSTVELLRRFHAGGGRLLILGSLPDGVELPGERYDSLETMLPQIPPAFDLRTPVDADAREIAVGMRIHRGRMFCSLANFNDHDCQVSIGGVPPDWLLYEPVDDVVAPLPESLRIGRFRMVHLLPAALAETLLDPAGRNRCCPELATGRFPLPRAGWRIARTRPNVCLIDRFGAPGSEVDCVDSQAFSRLSGPTGFHRTVVLPCRLPKLTFGFEPEGLERLQFNYRDLLHLPRTVHDATPDLAEVDLTGLQQTGVNLLHLVNRRRRLEYCYLFGDFRVGIRGRDVEVMADAPLDFGDLAAQGLPFYWGSVRYCLQFEWPEKPRGSEQLVLTGELAGVAVTLNTVALPADSGASVRIPLRAALRPGTNRLTIEVYNTAQNFFGPHRKFAQLEQRTAWYPQPCGADFAGSDAFSLAGFGLFDLPYIEY